MLFKVISNYSYIDTTKNNVAFLVKDNWNDWWTYSTLYDLYYIDNNFKENFIGQVKIGQFNMAEHQSSPNIPNYFECLDNIFFSLGQSTTYYENLNKIEDDLVKTNILNSLNDIVNDEDLLSLALSEEVTRKSLLRDIPLKTVQVQFKRILDGGVRLTPYNFTYTSFEEKSYVDPINLSFNVVPNSSPPTNIHVLIGRNGVGKTRLIKNIINCIINENSSVYGYIHDESTFDSTSFTNVIFVSFSAFDKNIPVRKDDSEIPFAYIGLTQYPPIDSNTHFSKTPDDLGLEFANSLESCLFGPRDKFKLWQDLINILESDPIFKSYDIGDFLIYADDIIKESISNSGLFSIDKSKETFKEKALRFFEKLSSGHKIIMLTITRLVECVEEKTLVILDEPESHLHPPLLSAFVRALSKLMISKNAVSIIATHSPVILQEIPKSCVWKLRRSSHHSVAERLNFESFGENVSLLTSEVFGLEVTHSGYHTMLSDIVNKSSNRDYSEIISIFKNELGMEAKAILRGLIADKSEVD